VSSPASRGGARQQYWGTLRTGAHADAGPAAR
jgi:hypothetical protein